MTGRTREKKKPVSIRQQMNRLVATFTALISLVFLVVVSILTVYQSQYEGLMNNVTTASEFNLGFKDSIYKVQIDQNGSEVTLYWFIEFDNAIVLEDGSISMNYGQYDEMSRWDSYYEFMDETGKTKKYIGYKELDSFVNDYVETNRDVFGKMKVVQKVPKM